MELYETDDDYNICQIQEFEVFLDNNIGTEYERNDCGGEKCFYLIIFDLTQQEVCKIMKFETELRKKENKCKYLVE